MARAMLQSLASLEKWFAASSSRMTKLAKGNGTPGTRAGPTQHGNNDPTIGSRLDVGDLVQSEGGTYRRYHWQLNKNAANSTLRKTAQQDSHKTWSYADVEVKENPTADEARDSWKNCFGDLKDNIEDP